MKTRCKSRFQLDMKRDFSPPIKNDIKDDENGIAYTIQLPKQAGVNWGSDLSFRFVYVNSLDPIPGGAYDAGVRVGYEYYISGAYLYIIFFVGRRLHHRVWQHKYYWQGFRFCFKHFKQTAFFTELHLLSRY